MSSDELDPMLRDMDPRKRAFIKRVVVGGTFAVPLVASYSVKDLAHAQIGSGPVTTTIVKTTTVITTT